MGGPVVPASLILGILFVSGRVLNAAHIESVPPTETILKDLLAINARVKSFAIEYQSFSREDQYYVHRCLCAQTPSLCFYRTGKGQLAEILSGVSIGREWEHDYFQECLIVSGRRCRRLRPMIQQIEDSELPVDGELPAKIGFDFFIAATGLWPFVDCRFPLTSNGARLVIPDICSSDDYKLRAEMEDVGGHSCFVLEFENKDCIWLDADSLAFVARMFYAPESGAPIQRIEMADHREVVPGVWMPFTCRNILYTRDSVGAASTSNVRRADINLTRVDFTEGIHDPLFSWNLEPGAVDTSSNGAYTQMAVGGTALIERAVKQVQSYRVRRNAFVRWPGLITGALALISAIIALYSIGRLMSAFVRGSAMRR